MATSSRPTAFILRCRQADFYSSRSSLRDSLRNLPSRSNKQTFRAASTTSPSSLPPIKPAHTAFPSTRPSTQQTLPRGAFSPTTRRPSQIRTAQPLNLWTAVKSVFGWKPSPAPFVPAPFTTINNPYRARKIWPPDFTTLHPKHQFHFEKTYRRRAKLKYARPNWIKGTKIVQFGLTVVIIAYWIFFLEVEGKESTPFDAFKKWSSEFFDHLGTPPGGSREETNPLSPSRSKQESQPAA